jgi:hypothetical protein
MPASKSHIPYGPDRNTNQNSCEGNIGLISEIKFYKEFNHQYQLSSIGQIEDNYARIKPFQKNCLKLDHILPPYTFSKEYGRELYIQWRILTPLNIFKLKDVLIPLRRPLVILESKYRSILFWAKLYFPTNFKQIARERIESTVLLGPSYTEQCEVDNKLYLSYTCNDQGIKQILKPEMPEWLLTSTKYDGVERPFPPYLCYPWKEPQPTDIETYTQIPVTGVSDKIKEEFLNVVKELIKPENVTKQHLYDILAKVSPVQKMYDHIEHKTISKAEFFKNFSSFDDLFHPFGKEGLRFLKTPVWKCPGEMRDAVTATPGLWVLISYINNIVDQSISHRPEWGNDIAKDDMIRFFQDSEIYHFYLVDLKKSGLTIPHWIVDSIVEILISNKMDHLDLLKYWKKGGYPIDHVDGRTFYPKRGYGLGMSNAIHTLLWITIFHMWKNRYKFANGKDILSWFLSFNDDSALKIKSVQDTKMLYSAFLRIVAELGLIINEKKSVDSLYGGVFCEDFYISKFKYNHKWGMYFDTLSESLLCTNSWESQFQIGLSFGTLRFEKEELIPQCLRSELPKIDDSDKIEILLFNEIKQYYKQYWGFHLLPLTIEGGGVIQNKTPSDFLLLLEKKSDEERKFFLAHQRVTKKFNWLFQPWKEGKVVKHLYSDNEGLPFSISRIDNRINFKRIRFEGSLPEVEKLKFWKEIYSEYNNLHLIASSHAIHNAYFHNEISNNFLIPDWIVWKTTDQDWDNVRFISIKRKENSTYYEWFHALEFSREPKKRISRILKTRDIMSQFVQLPVESTNMNRILATPLQIYEWACWEIKPDILYEYYKRTGKVPLKLFKKENNIIELILHELKLPFASKPAILYCDPIVPIDKFGSHFLLNLPWEIHGISVIASKILSHQDINFDIIQEYFPDIGRKRLFPKGSVDIIHTFLKKLYLGSKDLSNVKENQEYVQMLTQMNTPVQEDPLTELEEQLLNLDIPEFDIPKQIIPASAEYNTIQAELLNVDFEMIQESDTESQIEEDKHPQYDSEELSWYTSSQFPYEENYETGIDPFQYLEENIEIGLYGIHESETSESCTKTSESTSTEEDPEDKLLTLDGYPT